MSYGLWLWYQQEQASPLRRFFWTGVGFKLSAGTILGILYLYYYPYRGDTWVLFDESVLLTKLAYHSPLAYLRTMLFRDLAHAQHYVFLTLAEQPRAFFMAKLLSLINLFTFTNYWITGFYCSVFSFWGLWKLANTLVVRLGTLPIVAAVSCLLFPSVVFWSSGVLKEAIAIACIGYLLAVLLSGFANTTITNRVWQVIGIAISSWILWQIKFYYLGALFLACTAWLATWQLSQLLPFTRLFVLRGIQLLVFAGMLNLLPLAYELLLGRSFLVALVANHNATLRSSQPGSFIIFSELQSTLLSFLQHFPLALWSGWFAPMPWQAQNGLSLLASLENVVLLLGLLACLGTLFRKQGGFHPEKDTIFKALFRQAMVLYCILLGVILAMASPNYGALVRYKVGFLPVLVFLLLDTLCTHYKVRIRSKTK